MISFVVAAALLVHVFLWGAGLAALVMPRPWRPFWPVLAFPAGFALQSLVVWLGAYANLHGTNAYAWPAEFIPVALLVVAIGKTSWHRFRLDLERFGLVGAATAAGLMLLVLPVAIASRGLTTTSLGSCDAADYAAGARTFMEFARGDRNGFLGLTEVVRVMSADNFFDFWLRLNHFTPSALIAFNGSILHCPPHELTGLMTMVVLSASVPVVFWVARALFGYSGAASLAVAGIYAISPIGWYSVAQVSPAPLLAANAIALLTWAGIALWRGRLTWRRAGMFAGVLGIGYAIVLGSYNFILIVALVPALAFVGGKTLVQGQWSRLARWLVVMIAPLVVAGVVFWDRVAGLVERFMLFQTYDFGWRIPLLTPEGWLGMVQGGSLQPWSWLGFRWLLAAIVLAALAYGVTRTARLGRSSRLGLVSAVIIPVLGGYTFLEARGVLAGTNASYDAFKLFAVFYPLLLPAFCWWITLRWSSRLVEWFAVAGLSVVVVGFNLIACAMFVFQLSRPPLIVDGELRQLRKIAAMPDVGSVNMLIGDMWSRLWANAFLLEKPQYFATHTYEGRLNTPLRGEWDLTNGIVRVAPAGRARQVTPHYWLVDTRAPGFVRAALGDGWYGEERLPNGERWSWTRAGATVLIDNPQSHPVALKLRLDGRGLGDRDVAIGLLGGPTPVAIHVGGNRAQSEFPPVVVPPGKSTLVLRSQAPAATAGADTRPLAVCVFALVIEPTQ